MGRLIDVVVDKEDTVDIVMVVQLGMEVGRKLVRSKFTVINYLPTKFICTKQDLVLQE